MTDLYNLTAGQAQLMNRLADSTSAGMDVIVALATATPTPR